MPFLQSTVAARRGGALILPVSENDANFCILLYWNAKIGTIFAYKFVPIFVAVNCNCIGLQKLPLAAAGGKIEGTNLISKTESGAELNTQHISDKMSTTENGAHAKLVRSFVDAIDPKFAMVMTSLAQVGVTLDGLEARVAAVESMTAGSVAAKRATVTTAAHPAAVAMPAALAAAAGAAPAGAAPAGAAPAAAAAAAAPAGDKAQNARLWFRDAFAAGAGDLRKFDTPAVREENREALKKHAPESEAYFKALGYLIWPKLSEAQKTQVKQSRAAGEERVARADSAQLDEE